MVYQLKYDSAQGRYDGKIERSEDGKFLIVDGKKIAINQELSHDTEYDLNQFDYVLFHEHNL